MRIKNAPMANGDKKFALYVAKSQGNSDMSGA
jgi:hypothetical protein